MTNKLQIRRCVEKLNSAIRDLKQSENCDFNRENEFLKARQVKSDIQRALKYSCKILKVKRKEFTKKKLARRYDF
jgi:hypothetical protein